MALGSEVHHVIGVVLLHELGHARRVADVGLHEDVARIALNGAQVLAIARIGERINVYNAPS